MQKRIPSYKIRIHRSFIVAVKKIDSYTPTSVEIGKRELTIGRNYKREALARLQGDE